MFPNFFYVKRARNKTRPQLIKLFSINAIVKVFFVLVRFSDTFLVNKFFLVRCAFTQYGLLSVKTQFVEYTDGKSLKWYIFI